MSEVTRAEQLADELDEFTWPLMNDAATELRRLSAVEARCVELENEIERRRAHNSEMAVDIDHLRTKSARQSELIQQAKEAMSDAMGFTGSREIDARLSRALSAINEGGKSNG